MADRTATRPPAVGPHALARNAAGTAVLRASVVLISLPIASHLVVGAAVTLEPSTSTPPVTHQRHHEHHDEGQPDPHPEGHGHASGPAVNRSTSVPGAAIRAYRPSIFGLAQVEGNVATPPWSGSGP